jgi:hypothetical protein
MKFAIGIPWKPGMLLATCRSMMLTGAPAARPAKAPVDVPRTITLPCRKSTSSRSGRPGTSCRLTGPSMLNTSCALAVATGAARAPSDSVATMAALVNPVRIISPPTE